MKNIKFALIIVNITFFGIAMLFFTDGQFRDVKTMQTDTLNQIMEIRQEIDALKAESEPKIEPQGSETEKMVSLADPELIARVIAAEARGSGIEGQMAVVQVIYDRSWLWGMPPEDVVSAPSQFADPFQGKIPATTWEALGRVFYGGERVWDEPVTHFHSTGVTPYWTSEKVCRGEKGGNVFWY